MIPAWVIVCTEPSFDEIAERGFRRAGYRTYLPRYRKLLFLHGQQRSLASVMRPLFPGYVFAQDWRGWPTQTISGIVGLLKQGGSAVRLPAADIQQIRDQEWAMAFDEGSAAGEKPLKRTDLKPGDMVETELFGHRIVAELEQLSDNGKAVIRDLLGIGRRLTVPAEPLQLVAS